MAVGGEAYGELMLSTVFTYRLFVLLPERLRIDLNLRLLQRVPGLSRAISCAGRVFLVPGGRGSRQYRSEALR